MLGLQNDCQGSLQAGCTQRRLPCADPRSAHADRRGQVEDRQSLGACSWRKCRRATSASAARRTLIDPPNGSIVRSGKQQKLRIATTNCSWDTGDTPSRIVGQRRTGTEGQTNAKTISGSTTRRSEIDRQWTRGKTVRGSPRGTKREAEDPQDDPRLVGEGALAQESLRCATCRKQFQSKNKFHRHLCQESHQVVDDEEDY